VFISYEYQKYLGYNSKTKEYSYQYKIIDSEFEEVVVGVVVWVEVAVGVAVAVGVEVAIIDAYEKRNLNVAANLMKAILYHHKKYPHISVPQIIEWNKKYNPKFAKYETDLQKYLCLL
jgi:hypothetical protein